MIRHPQRAHRGAMLSIPHSKRSKVMLRYLSANHRLVINRFCTHCI